MIGLSPVIWLAIGIVVMGLEILVPGFIIFWFGLGGVLTALLVWIKVLVTPESQWIFFFLSSLLFLGAWWLYFKKFFKSKKNAEESRDPTLTNIKGKVTTKITPDIPGQIELYEAFHSIKVWEAESLETIDAGKK